MSALMWISVSVVVGFSMLCIGYAVFCVYASLGLRLRLVWWIVSLGAISISAAIFLSSTDKILLSIVILAIVGVILIFVGQWLSCNKSKHAKWRWWIWSWLMTIMGFILMVISGLLYRFGGTSL